MSYSDISISAAGNNNNGCEDRTYETKNDIVWHILSSCDKNGSILMGSYHCQSIA
jgi:hypothetical protein